MGFITNVSISNDTWHKIAEDPQKLVDAISVGMDAGIDSPLTKAFEASDPNWKKSHNRYVRQQTPYGLVVHHARHADDPQVIANPYGSWPIAAHEIPLAIRYGWTDGERNAYRRDTAEKCAVMLEELAKDIRDALADKTRYR